MSEKTRLVVYDFDGTVANVPERPASWRSEDKDNRDWWGHPDSLSDAHYDGSVNHEVVESFKRDKTDPYTRVALLTGRRGVISASVRRVLRNNDLHGTRIIPASNTKTLDRHKSALEMGHDAIHPEANHEEYYSGDHSTEEDYPKGTKGKPDGSTMAFKLYIIQNKLMTPNMRVVEFWDDRADHIPHLIKLGLDLQKKYGVEVGGKLEKVILHRVYEPTYAGGQATVSHIPIKKGMNH